MRRCGIGNVHFTHVASKIKRFTCFIIVVISLRSGKMAPVLARTTTNTKNIFEYDFLEICKHLNIVKNQRINL